MDKEDSLMNVLSRLSYSIEQAITQKRTVEKQLRDKTEEVKMLKEANDALMKHVAGLEKRNEIIVNGLMKIVDTVEENCQKIKEESCEIVEPTSAEDRNSVLTKVHETLEGVDKDSVTNSTFDEADVYRAAEKVHDQASNAPFDEGLDEEPQSAELKSLVEHPIDPLVYSNIMDYAAEPDEVLLPYHRISSGRIRSGRLRSGRLRSSMLRSSLEGTRSFFRRHGRSQSYVDGTRNVESRRTRRSGGIREEANSIPVPEAGCGCFLQSIFGCHR